MTCYHCHDSEIDQIVKVRDTVLCVECAEDVGHQYDFPHVVYGDMRANIIQALMEINELRQETAA